MRLLCSNRHWGYRFPWPSRPAQLLSPIATTSRRLNAYPSSRPCHAATQVCGSLDAVIERCNRGRCAAFTWDGKCGYLKNAAGPVKYREGFVKYTRNAPVAPVAKPVAKPGAVAVIILPVATAKPAAKPAVTINVGHSASSAESLHAVLHTV